MNSDPHLLLLSRMPSGQILGQMYRGGPLYCVEALSFAGLEEVACFESESNCHAVWADMVPHWCYHVLTLIAAGASPVPGKVTEENAADYRNGMQAIDVLTRQGLVHFRDDANGNPCHKVSRAGREFISLRS